MHIDKITSKKQVNAILFSEPYTKLAFVSFFINNTNNKIIYVDFDLMTSGYIESGLLRLDNNKDITRIIPQKDKVQDTWHSLIKEIHYHKDISESIVIIDSLNGFFNQLDQGNPKQITSVLMFLFKIIRELNCTLIITTMARYKRKEKRWILSPTGDLILKACKANRVGVEWDFSKKGILVRLDKPQRHHLIPEKLIPVY